MADLTCPLCSLPVPPATRTAAEPDVCPRCLARTSGAVSVKLVPELFEHDAHANGGVITALRSLLPASPRR